MKLTPKNELEKKAIENKKAIAVVPNNKLKRYADMTRDCNSFIIQ